MYQVWITQRYEGARLNCSFNLEWVFFSFFFLEWPGIILKWLLHLKMYKKRFSKEQTVIWCKLSQLIEVNVIKENVTLCPVKIY